MRPDICGEIKRGQSKRVGGGRTRRREQVEKKRGGREPPLTAENGATLIRRGRSGKKRFWGTGLTMRGAEGR